jgi:hypothetical protein
MEQPRKKIGRPPSLNPRNVNVTVVLTRTDAERLDQIVQEQKAMGKRGRTRSQVVYEWISAPLNNNL